MRQRRVFFARMARGILALGAAAAAAAQPGTSVPPGRSVQSGPAGGQGAPCQPLRQIPDPATGLRWVLLRDAAHPGGPLRLIPAELCHPEGGLEGALAGLRPAVLAGDRVTVERSTAGLEERLEGIALGPTAAGGALRVRLKVTGKVVRAFALGEGRVERAAGASAWESRP